MTTSGEILASKSDIGSASAADHLIAVLGSRLVLPQTVEAILIAISAIQSGTAAEYLFNLSIWGVTDPAPRPNYILGGPGKATVYTLGPLSTAPIWEAGSGQIAVYVDGGHGQATDFTEVSPTGAPSYAPQSPSAEPDWQQPGAVGAQVIWPNATAGSISWLKAV
jgi:hypothetical protein